MTFLKNIMPQHRTDLLFSFIILSVFFFTQSKIAPIPDTTWLMLCAEKWLQGGTYYNDFIEVNPPASILLHVPIIFLQHIFSSIAPYKISFYYFFFLTSCSIILCLLLRGYFEKNKKNEVYSLVFISTLLMALMLPNIHFGQRDYILFIASLPYILSHIMRTYHIKIPQSLEWGCYIWSAIFMILKPHFYIVVIGLSLFRVYIKKDIFQIIKDPANYIIGIIATVYLISIYFFFSEFFTLIFADVINIYINGSVNLLFHFWTKTIEFTILLPVLTALTLFIKNTAIRNTSALMLFLSTLFFIGFILQKKGFPYHYLPAQILLYASIPVIISGIFKRFINNTESKILSYALILYCIFLFIGKNSDLDHSIVKYEHSEKIAYLNDNVKSGEYYSILQHALGSSAPSYYYSQGSWGSRFPSIWFMNDLLEEKKQNKPLDNKIAFEQTYKKYQNLIIEDLKNNKPKLILIPTEGNFLEFMSDSENFKTIWKYYRYKEQKIFPIAHELYNHTYAITYDVYCLGC